MSLLVRTYVAFYYYCTASEYLVCARGNFPLNYVRAVPFKSAVGGGGGGGEERKIIKNSTPSPPSCQKSNVI